MDKKQLVRWTIILCGLYFLCQIVADVAAAKIAFVAGYAIPAGTFVYAVTFTLRDLIQKVLGKTVARFVIIAAAVFNILMAGYFVLAVNLAPAPFWPLQDAYATTLGIVPRIVIASIIAELISELVDTEVYSFWIKAMGQRLQWTRVVVSNAVSVPVDSFIFLFLAFWGHMPVEGMIAAAWGQILLKYAVGVVSIPAIYYVPTPPSVAAELE